MNTTQPSTEILLRLTREALPLFYCCAENYVGRAIPGITMALSGEPVADLNYLVIDDASESAQAGFRGLVGHCDAQDLPFAVIVAPAVAEALEPLRAELDLVYATDWPLMVCPGEAVQDHPREGVQSRPVRDEEDRQGLARVLAGAFQMPAESVLRAMPRRLFDSPSIEGWVAAWDGAIQSTVTATWHGSVVGIWAMGTAPEAQGQGVGKALLSRVMHDARQRGAEAFFLGATPSGFPLYERLGYVTVADCPIWVRGVTHQA
ncbi:MAG: GNAT family N-acetyltransferase [Xanthomonadales bacterium]|jgi:GNAT superfamily N-acetyltransferase|nr:GNAT family N-acetyltransferase [Xanthomonadales bacterium]